MKLLGKKILQDFKEQYPEAKSQIDSWEAEVEEAQWATPHDLKKRFPKASILGNQQAIFNICWNKYRLWVQVSYKNGIVWVRNIGTHKEYDGWNIV